MLGINTSESASETWSERNAFWFREHSERAPRRRRRERPAAPLVLAGHGISLRVDSGALLIRNGRTHYPQDPEVYRFFRGGMDRPTDIIVLDGSGVLTFDVIDWRHVDDEINMSNLFFVIFPYT